MSAKYILFCQPHILPHLHGCCCFVEARLHVVPCELAPGIPHLCHCPANTATRKVRTKGCATGTQVYIFIYDFYGSDFLVSTIAIFLSASRINSSATFSSIASLSTEYGHLNLGRLKIGVPLSRLVTRFGQKLV